VEACQVRHGVDPAFSWDADGGSGGGVFGELARALAACGTPCALGNDWSCVGSVSWPEVMDRSAAIHFRLSDYSTSTPSSGVSAAVCPAADVDCPTPLGTGMTGPDGEVTAPFTMPAFAAGYAAGLNGYLRFTSPSIAPFYVYWGYPLSTAGLYGYGFTVMPSELQALYTSLNIVPDPSRGTLAVSAYDCRFYFAPRVQVTLSTADAMTLAVISGQAVSTLDASAVATDQSGTVFFLNVPQGNFTVSTVPMSTGRLSSTVTVGRVRAGTTTSIYAYPTP
jgi:hypothetical protein